VTTLSLTVLGCDGSYPGPGGACSGYLLSAGSTHLWLDAGPGTLANLQQYLPVEELDAVVLTHSHIDHWSDLEHLAVACHWVVKRTPVPVYAPFEAELLRVGEAVQALSWNCIDDEQRLDLGVLSLVFARTDHPVATLAVRAELGERRIVYTADTGPAWKPATLGPEPDLLLSEATYLSDREGDLQHLSARQAGEMARDAGAKRLVLTHMWPRIDRDAARKEAEVAFGSPVEVASIGARYEV
jgi:ribonuclease BN (tRNA processing enzyme)